MVDFIINPSYYRLRYFMGDYNNYHFLFYMIF